MRGLQDVYPALVVDVRGLGLWCAVELGVDANPVVARMQQLGVLVGSVLNQSGTVRIMPPLVITFDQIDEFLGVLRTVLDEVVTDEVAPSQAAATTGAAR